MRIRIRVVVALILAGSLAAPPAPRPVRAGPTPTLRPAAFRHAVRVRRIGVFDLLPWRHRLGGTLIRRWPLPVVWPVSAPVQVGGGGHYPDLIIERAVARHIEWRWVYVWRHGRYHRQTAERLYHLGDIVCGTRAQCNRSAGRAARAGDLPWALTLWRITGHRPAI
ncbi:MAG: hypothetical protein ACYCXG_06560 [Acidiferrobacter sp.]